MFERTLCPFIKENCKDACMFFCKPYQASFGTVTCSIAANLEILKDNQFNAKKEIMQAIKSKK